MKEILQEYGELILEISGGMFLLGILASLFLGSPFTGFLEQYIHCVVG